MNTELIQPPSGTTGADVPVDDGVQRRDFLTWAAATPAALTVATKLATDTPEAHAQASAGLALNNYLTFFSTGPGLQDYFFLLDIPRVEAGQGILTSSAMLTAEELEIPIEKIRARGIEWTKLEQFATTLVGASGSTRSLTDANRAAAAEVRGRVGKSGAVAGGKYTGLFSDGTSYNSAAAQAALAAGPSKALAKAWDPSNFKIVGKGTKPFASAADNTALVYTRANHVSREDSLAIVTGSNPFTSDIENDALNCVIMHSFEQRCSPRSVDVAGIKALGASKGINVRAVVPFDSKGNGFGIYTAVGIICDTMGEALEVRRGIIAAVTDDRGNSKFIQWNTGPTHRFSSEFILEKMKGAVGPDPLLGKALATRQVKGSVYSPYQAQGTLGTQAAVAQFTSSGVDVWWGSQVPKFQRIETAREMGFPTQPKRVRLRITRDTSHFGRNLLIDSAIEACYVSRAVFQQGGLPNKANVVTSKVKVMWPRNDDIRFSPGRPAAFSRFIANLDGSGKILSLNHKYVTYLCEIPSGFDNIVTTTLLSSTNQTGYDYFPLATPSYYSFVSNEAFREVLVPFATGAMRSVYSISAVGHKEIFLDEVCRQIGATSGAARFAVREQYMRSKRIKNLMAVMKPRILELAAEVDANNKVASNPKMGIGFGFHEEWGSAGLCACTVRQAVDGQGKPLDLASNPPKILRVINATDAGHVINGSGLSAQAEGAFGDAVALAFFSGITHKNGAAQQSTFLDYYWQRMRECDYVMEPTVFTKTTDNRVGGAGELHAATSFGALGNAWGDLNFQLGNKDSNGHSHPSAFPIYKSPSPPLTDR